MRALVFSEPGRRLQQRHCKLPVAKGHSIVIQVEACGVCRTDLHILDGELAHPSLPLIPGHQIVGLVVEVGSEVTRFRVGERIGVPWLGKTCGVCKFCHEGRENLCDQPLFTGYQRNGGFAEYAEADSRYAFAIPDSYDAIEAAPLLCAGLIGYRALCMTEDAEHLGLFGFGSAAHIVTQIARHQGTRVSAFTRPGDVRAQSFARSLGASWAGGSNEKPSTPLDAAIIFAPVGSLVPAALSVVEKGGVVVCAGIHMSDLPSFPYSLLWNERVLRSVANLTRDDGDEFFKLAPQIPIRTHVTQYELADTMDALDDLRMGQIEGAAVVTPERNAPRKF
jgi:propanol-preferring alcohol dehydrogenase